MTFKREKIMKKVKEGDILQLKINDCKVTISVADDIIHIKSENNSFLGVSPVSANCIGVTALSVSKVDPHKKGNLYDV